MLERWTLQSRLFIQQAMIELRGDRLQFGVEIGQVGHPADRLLRGAADRRLDLEGVAMQVGVGPVGRAFGQVVRGDPATGSFAASSGGTAKACDMGNPLTVGACAGAIVTGAGA